MLRLNLTTEQLNAVNLGRAMRRRLTKESQRAAKRALNKDRDVYLDSLISGDSGVGKSYVIEKTLNEYNVLHVKITGTVSLYGLMGNLMLLHANKPVGQRMVIFLDDCDFLFEPSNINLLKHMTATQSKDRKFEYTKKIRASDFTDAQAAVLDQYVKEGQHGLEIPCDEFVFVIASNFVLPNEQTVKTMKETQRRKADHLLAIRGRFNPFDFELNKHEKWGWLYDVAINDNALECLKDEQDRLYLLDFVWQNWDRMKETSVRTIQKMAYEIIEDPEYFKDNWELDYLV